MKAHFRLLVKFPYVSFEVFFSWKTFLAQGTRVYILEMPSELSMYDAGRASGAVTYVS